MQLRGLGEPLDLREVAEVYLPLSRLLNLYVGGTKSLHDVDERVPARTRRVDAVRDRRRRLGRRRQVDDRPPAARAARPLGAHAPRRAGHDRRVPASRTPSSSDAASWQRKGFPESYDRRALLRFVSEVKSGAAEVRAPFYSHLAYDIVPDAQVTVRRPDVLIIEGLNVLQPPAPGHRLAVSDLFDFTIYVDARTSDIARWYEERFLQAAARGVLEPALLLPPLREPHRGRRRASGRARSGTRSTSRTCCRTSGPPGRARRSCCARAPITRSRACCSASSEPGCGESRHRVSERSGVGP